MTFLLISEPFDELQEILNDLSDNKLKKNHKYKRWRNWKNPGMYIVEMGNNLKKKQNKKITTYNDRLKASKIDIKEGSSPVWLKYIMFNASYAKHEKIEESNDQDNSNKQKEVNNDDDDHHHLQQQFQF